MGQAGHRSPSSDHCSRSICVCHSEGSAFLVTSVWFLAVSCLKTDLSVSFLCPTLSGSLSLSQCRSLPLFLSLSLGLFPSPLILGLCHSLWVSIPPTKSLSPSLDL